MQSQERTWLCSVVFIDIAGYTERSVTRQINAKGKLETLIEQIITVTPENERVIVDTGDGAALCYLGDPEQALLSAVRLRDALLTRSDNPGEPVSVRIGVNLGPVRLHRNLKGQLNPLGDGINNAQRVMSFADPGQILVSRSFFDVIACLSQEYSQLFSYLGMRLDKHQKSHPVYEVRIAGHTGDPVTEQTTRKIAEQARTQRLETPEVTWDPAVLKRAEDALAEFVGPVAPLLVKKAIVYARDADALYRRLADALPADERQKLYRTLGLDTPTGNPAAMDSRSGDHSFSSNSSAISPEELQDAETRLAVYIGPVARVMVRKAAQSTSDRMRFYQLLTEHLGSDAERQAFLASVGPSRQPGSS